MARKALKATDVKKGDWIADKRDGLKCVVVLVDSYEIRTLRYDEYEFVMWDNPAVWTPERFESREFYRIRKPNSKAAKKATSDLMGQ